MYTLLTCTHKASVLKCYRERRLITPRLNEWIVYIIWIFFTMLTLPQYSRSLLSTDANRVSRFEVFSVWSFKTSRVTFKPTEGSVLRSSLLDFFFRLLKSFERKVRFLDLRCSSWQQSRWRQKVLNRSSCAWTWKPDGLWCFSWDLLSSGCYL